MKLDSLFKDISDVEVELDKDLTKFSTMKLKAMGDLITVSSVEALSIAIKKLKENNIDYHILGMGANQLLKSKLDKPYLMLKLPFDKSILDEVQQTYVLPASLKLSVLTSHASKFGLKGWEVFTGIPATLGGAVFMNAGTGLGEICELIKKVWIVDSNGDSKEIVTNEDSFSYRKNHFLNKGDFVYQVELINKGTSKEVTEVIRNYLQRRNDTQPMREKTCGCMFKNSKYNEASCPAGKFIDIIGLKGLQVGGIRVSDTHGNFFENVDEAQYEDVVELMNIVQSEMMLQFGVQFDFEARI